MKIAAMVLLLPLYPILFLHWLACRLHAQRCPECGSGWKTELVGEWGDEQWMCHHCGHGWFVPYRKT
jgi:hypothetical protein